MDQQDERCDGAVVIDRDAPRAPFLPELAPRDHERVDGYVARASADATLRAYKPD